jgi:hypothetical protein
VKKPQPFTGPKGHYRLHNSPPQDSYLSQIQPLHIFTPCSLKVWFLFLLLFTSTYSKFSLYFYYCKIFYTFLIASVNPACSANCTLLSLTLQIILDKSTNHEATNYAISSILLLLPVLAQSLTFLNVAVSHTREHEVT